jgi:predicted secreted protein
MGWATGLMVYAIIWWTVIFAVLPWGTRAVEDPAPGHATGAPANPRLGLKAAITTAISAVIWVGVELLVRSDLISFRDMAARM